MKKNRNSKVIRGGYSNTNRNVPADTIYTIAYDTYRDEFTVYNTASGTSYILPLSIVKDFLEDIKK